MNLVKSYDFFKPEEVEGRIHIIGCGSVGSAVAENLARFGLTKFSLWDFDVVEEKNVANQMFTSKHIGMLKTDATEQIILDINPAAAPDIKKYPKGYEGQILSGFVFLCADNIDLRRQIVEKHKMNPNVKAMFDFRTRLTDAQHYAADWSNPDQVQNLLNSMQFTSDEADQDTPVSACGGILGVATTVRFIVAVGVDNFVNFVKGGGIKKFVMADAFAMQVDAF